MFEIFLLCFDILICFEFYVQMIKKVVFLVLRPPDLFDFFFYFDIWKEIMNYFSYYLKVRNIIFEVVNIILTFLNKKCPSKFLKNIYLKAILNEKNGRFRRIEIETYPEFHP